MRDNMVVWLNKHLHNLMLRYAFLVLKAFFCVQVDVWMKQNCLI